MIPWQTQEYGKTDTTQEVMYSEHSLNSPTNLFKHPPLFFNTYANCDYTLYIYNTHTNSQLN